VLAGVKYMISAQKPDGGIYEAGLPSYNTAICLSALAKVDATRVPQVKDAIASATAFLKGLQYSEDVRGIAAGEAPNAVQKEHAFYGGWGYGKHGRPDLSNTHWALDGLHDAGVAPDDAAFQRALVFLSRCQMSDVSNDMAYADGAAQGGFIYATSENKDKIASGQSMAGTIEETLDDGTKVSRLRAYGSMTYAGFKSYLYAGLTKDDPRVVAAMKWIGENYTLAENPGAGTDGYYYYLVTFARALEASGQKTISGPAWKEPGGTGKSVGHDWRKDLVNRLAELQNADGSFKTIDDRWLENDPVLITAYSLLALEHASK
jgi:squalene-hopene/tetraprenyl-beta-curcumene cyclase